MKVLSTQFNKITICAFLQSSKESSQILFLCIFKCLGYFLKYSMHITINFHQAILRIKFIKTLTHFGLFFPQILQFSLKYNQTLFSSSLLLKHSFDINKAFLQKFIRYISCLYQQTSLIILCILYLIHENL